MRAELKRKSTRTVHGDKVVRLRIDIRYDELQDVERNDQDILKWLDMSVDEMVRFNVGPFEDEDQTEIIRASSDEPRRIDYRKD